MRRAERLFTRADVEQAAEAMATRITHDLGGLNPIIIAIMNGGMVPLGLLLPRLPFLLRVDYLHATRYRGATSGAELEWHRYPNMNLEGQHLLVVDDILDEGYTLEAVLAHCRALQPASLRAAALVEKIHDRGTGLKADYVGLQVPDRYVFGFGMDYKTYWRNANGIFAVAQDGQA